MDFHRERWMEVVRTSPWPGWGRAAGIAGEDLVMALCQKDQLMGVAHLFGSSTHQLINFSSWLNVFSRLWCNLKLQQHTTETGERMVSLQMLKVMTNWIRLTRQTHIEGRIMSTLVLKDLVSGTRISDPKGSECGCWNPSPMQRVLPLVIQWTPFQRPHLPYTCPLVSFRIADLCRLTCLDLQRLKA